MLEFSGKQFNEYLIYAFGLLAVFYSIILIPSQQILNIENI